MVATALRKLFSSRSILFTLLLCICMSEHLVAQTSANLPKNTTGQLSGTIRDEYNNPISGASISVEKGKTGTSTSISGDYQISISGGVYTIIVSAIGYDQLRITDVVIKAGSQTDLNLNLKVASSRKLEAVVITSTARKETARGLLLAQKNNSTVTDGISADQMKVTPDLNIGQSLVRISGVNVQSGKFVTIRGVSDRYNNVLINGSTLPSTEPNRRNFSFDLVPSALVDNIVVNKTASPDLPGEFTGGLVQVNTKDVPSKNFLEIAIGTGINTASTNQDFIGFERDKRAAIGKINKDRLWFGKGRPFEAFTYFNAFNSLDTVTTRRISRSIPNRWQYFKNPYTPVQNYQVTGGLAKKFKNSNSLGVVAAITYLNEQTTEEGNARSVSNYDYSSTRYKYNTTIGSLLNVAYKTRKHKIAWKNLYNLRYTNQVDDREGLNVSQSSVQRRFSDVTFQGRLIQTRLEGEHQFTAENLKIDWYADNVHFKREQPDTRYLAVFGPPQYSFDLGQQPLTNGGLFASVFDEKRNNAGFNLSIPFFVKKEKQLLKIGYSFSRRNADFENTGLRILSKNPFAIAGQGYLPYYRIILEEYFNNGNLYYNPAYSSNFSTGDKYKGIQELHNVFAMVDLRFLKKFRLTGGVRNEQNKMTVTTGKFLFNNTESKLEDTTAIYNEQDLLPSFNLVYSLSNKINIRAAFSKTLSRPDFVERSYIQYYDFADQLIVYGDVGLNMTLVKNYDLRFEFYPSGGEILSLSFFYKDFKNPVERFYELGNPSNFVQYRNLPKATAKGFEIDMRKSLEFISPASSFLKYLMVNGNFTYLEGKLTSPLNVVQDRPIQGLAPYIINGGISFQHPKYGVNLTMNRSGKKIVNAGDFLNLIQYENSRTVLDLQLNGKFFKQKLEAKFSVGDMLNQPYIIYSNGNKNDGLTYEDPKGDAYNADSDFVNYEVKRGVNFYFNLLYKF